MRVTLSLNGLNKCSHKISVQLFREHQFLQNTRFLTNTYIQIKQLFLSFCQAYPSKFQLIQTSLRKFNFLLSQKRLKYFYSFKSFKRQSPHNVQIRSNNLVCTQWSQRLKGYMDTVSGVNIIMIIIVIIISLFNVGRPFGIFFVDSGNKALTKQTKLNIQNKLILN